MDIIPINPDGTFDSGPIAITTAAGWQEICRINNKGAQVLADFVVAGNTIGNLKVSQGVVTDDANRQDLVSSATTPSGWTVPTTQGMAYALPAPTFPLAIGFTMQAKFNSDADELIFWANTAGGANATVRVYGKTLRPRVS